MSEKTRFLVGFRYSATVPQDVGSMIDTFVAEQKDLKEIRRLSAGQRVLEMTLEAAETLAAQRPELSVEEDMELELLSVIPRLPPRLAQEVTGRLSVQVLDEESGNGLDQVRVICVGRNIAYEGITDKNGSADIDIHEPELVHVIASPHSGHWSKIIPPPKLQKKTELEIRLQKQSPGEGYGWGHKILGIEQVAERFSGRRIKVGLVDSGAAKQKGLTYAGGFNALTGKDTKWNDDEDGHGTHGAGIVAAQGDGLRGVAPAAEIYPVKVHPGGRTSDFVEAVNWCIDNYMDVVSIGVGSPCPSQQMEVVLLEAYDRGITCVAGAGNGVDVVSYPAAYEHVLAVSAIGKEGEFPEDALHVWAAGEPSGYEGLFFAGFSNFGPEIDICAPGVAISSMVPGGEAVWDGTSMACAFVAGLAALVLEAYPEIRTGNAYQPCYLRRILFDSATDLGLPLELQGAGLANAEAALAEAFLRRQQEEADLKAYKRALKAELEQARRRVEDLEQALDEAQQE